MKVLIVAGLLPNRRGQGNIFVLEQLNSLRKYYPNDTFDIYNIESNVNRLNYFLKRNEFRKFVIKNGYDVIHYHYGLTSLIGLHQKYNAKQIITLHGSDIQGLKYQRLISKYAISQYNYSIFVNSQMLSKLKDIHVDLSIIPCGVDSEIFKPMDLEYCRNKLKLPLDKILILYLGNTYSKVKNYQLFLDIVKTLSDKNRDFIGIELNSVCRKDIPLLMNSANVTVLTSFSEGSPQVIKESAFCERPIVTSDVGDVADILEGSSNSYIINNYNINDFGDAIEKAVINKNNTGFKNINSYSDKIISNKIYSIYKKLAIS